MKKVLLIMSASLIPSFMAAYAFDIRSLAGEEWYGLYLRGQKSGYGVNTLEVAKDGTVTVSEDARFHVAMEGTPQNMRMRSLRVFSPDGALLRIEEQIDDPARTTKFSGDISGETMLFKAEIAGSTKEEKLPKPQESLKDALKQAQLVSGGAKVGDEVSFSTFEPSLKKELRGVSRIMGVEERVLDGAPTKVYQVKTTLEALPESLSYVTDKGRVLEDTIGGYLMKRIEPKEVAQDVHYSNDVLVSNAVKLPAPIKDPQSRKSLRLRIEGPLTKEHLFQDDRQSWVQDGSGFIFNSQRIRQRVPVGEITSVLVPVTDPDVKQWAEPSLLVQSDNPRLIEKAKSIVGEERDATKVSAMLCKWVYDNVRTVYSARLSNSLEVLDSMEGDCTEHSMLFIGLARAVGLPAREVAGLVYVPRDQYFAFHQWAKVWVGRWIDVDPTFNQPLVDVTHIKLAEGDLYEQARIIPLIGKLHIEMLDKE